MTHYDVLGVRSDASAADIRRAYLAAARVAHPDVAGEAGDDAMRRLNSAWAVLGDPTSRSRYDETLRDDELSGGTRAPTINRPAAATFVPYHAVDEDDDDEWRYVDDDTDPETAPSSALQLAPIVLVAGGIIMAVVGSVVGVAPLVAFGGVAIAVGCVGFLMVPLMVMAKASTVEHRRDRERQGPRRRR